MDQHEQMINSEQAKEYAELLKIRETLMEKLTEWDNKLNESKEDVRKKIHKDAEKQIKDIQGSHRMFEFIVFYEKIF